MKRPIIRRAVRWTLGLFFAAAGANHFIAPEWYMKIMPPFLPWHRPLVFLSGALELALGLALLSRRMERNAAWGLAALLLGIFPANIHMALNPEAFPAIKPLALWLRLPLQLVLIGLVLWSVQVPEKAD